MFKFNNKIILFIYSYEYLFNNEICKKRPEVHIFHF